MVNRDYVRGGCSLKKLICRKVVLCCKLWCSGLVVLVFIVGFGYGLYLFSNDLEFKVNI